MPTTAAIRRRRALQKRGIGMPGDNTKILDVARSLRDQVDAPVLGGIAAYLYAWARTIVDKDAERERSCPLT